MSETQPSGFDLLGKARALFRKLRREEQDPTVTSRVRVLNSSEPPVRILRGVSIEQNAHAAQVFIERLRDDSRFHQDPYTRFLIDDRGIRIEPPLERGFLSTQDILNPAQERYHLPMVMFIKGAHAHLLLKGPLTNPGGERVIQVYDPMSAGISEMPFPAHLPLDLSSGIMANALAQAALEAGKYNISFLDDPQLLEYRHSLLNGKLAAIQKDLHNCIPYCLFTNALIQALKPGDTEFKNRGIPQFERDFGVRILKREELIKPRVRVK